VDVAKAATRLEECLVKAEAAPYELGGDPVDVELELFVDLGSDLSGAKLAGGSLR
jgi:hypothetical protein